MKLIEARFIHPVTQPDTTATPIERAVTSERLLVEYDLDLGMVRLTALTQGKTNIQFEPTLVPKENVRFMRVAREVLSPQSRKAG